MAVPKPAKPTPTPRSAATQSPPFPGYLSPSQTNQAVTGQVQAAQLPQQTLINQQAARSAAQAQAQQSSTQQGYDALAQILKSIGPATQQGYQSAAGDTAAYARGMSDGFAHLQSQTQGEAGQVLGLSGGSTAQVPMANLGGTGTTNALYDLNGYIPAAGLEREGAAFGAAADRLPASAAGQGWQERLKIAAQQAQDQQGFRDQQSTLAAQIPGLRQSALSNIQTQQNQLGSNFQTQLQNTASNKLAEQRNAISMITATETNPDGSLTPKGRADIAAQTGTDPVTGKPTLAAVRAQTQATQADARLAISQANLTRQEKRDAHSYSAQLKRLGIEATNTAIRFAQIQSKAKAGGFTPIQTQKFKGLATTIAYNSRNGFTDAKNVTHPKLSYQDAILEGEKEGVPLKYLLAEMNRAYQPGIQGRPMTAKDRTASPWSYPDQRPAANG